MFQSTPPARGATHTGTNYWTEGMFQSTPPARGATQWGEWIDGFNMFQSTPPARGATRERRWRDGADGVSIHAPRAGGDAISIGSMVPPVSFNPRPPRGGRPASLINSGSDAMFQSTPPARGATGTRLGRQEIDGVSIHAPRAGGDMRKAGELQKPLSFNPRPPRGGRPTIASYPVRERRFNPRPPRGGRRIQTR